MNASEPTFALTLFPNYAATSKREAQHTLASLAELIATTTGTRKEVLPWLKMARFGDRRTADSCLRHDANVIAVSGIEADYDGGQVTLDEAHETLVKQGLAALLYTSPSHAEGAPRWRVLCPLAEEMPQERRGHFLGRLNGLFRGIFAGESWTLSQSYYFGSVNQNPSHRVEVIEGEAIDGHDDLDTIWLGKSALSVETTNAGQDARADAELIRCVLMGEHLHVELVALAARYVGRGIPPATVTGLLQGLMLSHPDGARDERWHDRYNDLDRTVASAVRKYRGENEERRREVARLARRMMRDRRPSEEILAEVMLRAAAAGVPAADVEGILDWAARRELAQRDAAHA